MDTYETDGTGDEQEPAVLTLERVGFAYPGSSMSAVRDVSLTVRGGEHVCILGGNGSGKSTLLALMAALVHPSAGRARVCGVDTRDAAQARTVRENVACVFQQPEDQLVTTVVADDVAFGPENLRVPPRNIARRVDAALAAVDLADRAQSDPAELSGGQQQRVAIAGALAMRPRLLLLDEPTAMLDATGRAAVRRIVARAARTGIAVVHVTHFMEEALEADRVIVLKRGRIALQGAPDEVFAQPERLENLRLEEPFSLRLANALHKRGVDVAAHLREDALADDIARLARARSGTEGVEGAVGDGGDDREDEAADPDKQANETAARSGDCADEAALSADGESDVAVSFEHVSFSYADARSARKKRPGGRGIFARLAGRTRGADAPRALDEVGFAIERGTLTALVGRTGSGKSTAVELACALKLPGSGTVRIAGIDTADLTRRRELRRCVGYVAQLPERQLFAQTVFDDVAFGPRNLAPELDEDGVRERVLAALDAVGLPADDAFLRRSPFSLSGGQQRSVALAGVLALRQPVLALDEPMAGLDPAGRARMRALLRRLKQQGVTLLLVTHSMDDAAELADRVLVLSDGHLVADGSPAEVFAPTAGTSPSEGAGVGVPRALAFARKLSGRGVEMPRVPLTIDELVREVARLCPHA